jgi:hypothetical protein
MARVKMLVSPVPAQTTRAPSMRTTRSSARQTGLDAKPFDAVYPGLERTPEKATKPAGIDAGCQSLEEARLLAALVEAVYDVEHPIELLLRRFVGLQRLVDGVFELAALAALQLVATLRERDTTRSSCRPRPFLPA